MTLKNRVVLVTGGAKRIGQALALAIASRGAHVAISYNTSAADAKRTVKMLEHNSGRKALAVRADLSRSAEVKRLIGSVASTFKRLDVLINCAANFQRVSFDKLTERDWDFAMDTNAKGPFLCSLYASKLMLRSGGGKIINMADWAGVRPYRNYLPYCVSKAAVIGLTKTLAKELAPKIQVTAIAPGPVLAPPDMSAAQRNSVARRVPLRHWGQPQDIINTALFLIEGTDFMTGSTVFVDGGQIIA